MTNPHPNPPVSTEELELWKRCYTDSVPLMRLIAEVERLGAKLRLLQKYPSNIGDGLPEIVDWVKLEAEDNRRDTELTRLQSLLRQSQEENGRLRVLTERAYPKGMSGICSAHADEGHIECLLCYPDLNGLIEAHNELKQKAWKDVDQLTAANRQLKEQVEELRKDKERLDWLDGFKTGNFEAPYWKIYEINPGSDLRNAIDVQIKGEVKQDRE